MKKQMISKNIILKEISEYDTDFIVEIRLDESLNALSKNNISREIHQKWYEKYSNNKDDHYFVIFKRNNMQRIGTIAIFNIDQYSKKAEYGRFILLEDFRIFALEIELAILEYGFETLELNKIYGFVRDGDKKIISFNKNIGFKQDGILREHYWDSERYVDLYMVSMLKKEYFEYKNTKYLKYYKMIEGLARIC